MVNVNKTKESIQNVLIFITDAIALIMSYYMSGFIWLMEIRNNTFSYVMKVLNGNIVTIIIAVLIAALFCNIKGDVLNRGKFEELASVMKKSLISSAVIAVYELLSKTAQGVPRSVYVITFFMGTVLMFLLRMLVKVYMKHRNGGKRTNSILVITIKNRAEDTLSKAAARNDWMRRIDGIVITDEDMTGQSIEGFPVVANVHSMMRYIKNEIVDEVFIDVDYKTRESIKPMVMELEDMGVIVNRASIIPVSTPRRIAYGLPIIKNAVEHTTIFIDIIISCTLKYTFIKLRSPTCTAPTSSLNIVFSRQLLYFSIPAAAYIVPIKHTTSPATAITHHVITGTECFLIIVKNICCPSPSIIIPLHFSKNA